MVVIVGSEEKMRMWREREGEEVEKGEWERGK